MHILFKNKNLNILMLYALVISILYFQVVFWGKSLLSVLYFPAGSNFNYAYGGRQPVNTFDIDWASNAFNEEPINRLVGNMYLKGNVPLWNPYQGCGIPLAAQYSTRVFFPYQILENLTPYWAWDYFILGRLLIAGFFTYLFLVAVGVSSAPAFLGGLFYMFSGSSVWFINNEQFMNVAMTIPLVIFCIEKMIRCQVGRWSAASALAIGLVLLAGQPEIAIYVLLLAFMYYVFRILVESKKILQIAKKIIKFIAVFSIGLGIASIVVLPFIEFMRNAYHCHPLGGSMGNVEGIPPPGFVLNLFLPHMLELSTFYRYFPHNGTWDYLGGYFGISMISLIFFALFYGKHLYRKYFLFFTLFGFFILLKNFGCPLTFWIGYLPLFDQSWSPRWAGPVWTFALSCAAALGFEIIFGSTKNKKFLIWTLVSIIFCISCFAVFILYRNLLYQNAGERYALDLETRASLAIIIPQLLNALVVIFSCLFMFAFLITKHKFNKDFMFGVIFIIFLELWFCIPKGMDNFWVILKILPFIAGIVSIFLLIKGRKKLAIVGCCFTLIFIVWLDINTPRGFPQRFNIFYKKPYLNFLLQQKDHFRIVGGEGLLMPNYASVFGITDIRFIASLSPATYQNYVNRHLLKLPHQDITDRLWFTGVSDTRKETRRTIYEEIQDNLTYYSFLGVKYILAPAETFMDLPLVYDGEIKIYENPFCLPRVFIADQFKYAVSYVEAQEIMGQDDFDLRNIVVLEEPVGFLENKASLGEEAVALIKDYQPNRVVISVSLKRPGVLVLTDVFFPGWIAYVDNQPNKIYRVNGLVRGVLLVPGNHTVVFKYSPLSFKLGVIISCFCFILTVFLFIRVKKIKWLKKH